MKCSQSSSLFQGDMAKTALIESFVKLNPAVMYRNPVMFTVEIGTAVMFFVCLQIAFGGDTTQGSLSYNIVIFAVLFLDPVASLLSSGEKATLKTPSVWPSRVIKALLDSKPQIFAV